MESGHFIFPRSGYRLAVREETQKLLSLALTAAALSTATVSQASEATATKAPYSKCQTDAGPMLSLIPEEFDQGSQGWRALAMRPGCELASADVIASYRTANWHKLSQNDLHALYWHEGQLRATAGQNNAAVPLLMAGVSPRGLTFADYSLATIAFLHGDLEALKAARARLAAIPEPPNFKQAQASSGKSFKKAKWPPNLDVVDGLIACFGKTYAEAYSPKCRPK